MVSILLDSHFHLFFRKQRTPLLPELHVERQLNNRISKPSATNLFGIHRTFHNSTSFSDVCIKYLCIDRAELFTKVITVDKEKVELD